VNTNHASARPGWDDDAFADAFDAGHRAGYEDGRDDAVHLLVWPLVVQAARLTNPDGLSYSLGRAIAVGESRQSAPTNGGGS
jgi:hypothetical protein